MTTTEPARWTPAVVEIAQDEILTGEAVALDVQPLGFFMRALGALLDMLIGFVLLYGAFVVFGFFAEIGLIDQSTVTIAVITMLVIVWVVIPTAVETLTRGRSIGKFAVGGRIVRLDGGSIGFRQAFIRALIGVLEVWMTFGAVAALIGAFTPRSQRLGDLVAGTYSERTRTPPLPQPMLGIPPHLSAWAATADVARLPDALARRVSQFLRNAPNMAPHARARASTALAEETMPFVSPDPGVDPETLLWGVAAVRRDREARKLTGQARRVHALVGVAAQRQLGNGPGPG